MIQWPKSTAKRNACAGFKKRYRLEAFAKQTINIIHQQDIPGFAFGFKEDDTGEKKSQPR
ncbi:MAG: hypothetical protein QW728_04200 [Thermoplasmata archaeon]